MPDKENSNSAWGGEFKPRTSFPESSPPKKSPLKWFFGVPVGVIILAGLVLFVIFLRGSGSPSVSIEFSGLNEILVGNPFSLDVTFSNDSENILKSAQLSLFLPDGVYAVGEPKDQRVVEEVIGDLGPGSLNKETFSLIVTEGAKSIKKMNAKLRYTVAPNEKIFYEKQVQTELNIGEPTLALEIEAPQSVFSGENFEFKVKYKNNSKKEIKNLSLKLEYPPIFQFQEASIKPDRGNNAWDFGSILAGEEAEMLMRGSVVGQEGSFFNFRAIAESKFSGQSYEINNQTANVGVSVAPLSLSITLNGRTDHVAALGQNLKYVLTYRNNSDYSLSNVTIKGRLGGELFDFSKAKSNGAFNSLTNTFSWSVANEPKLSSLAPGEQGSVSIDVPLLTSFPIRRFSDKNFSLKAQGEIESPTVPPGTAATKTISITTMENKVAGLIDLDAKAYFRDAASGILNSGPYPPKVNTPTQYTIHWVIRNYSTDMNKIKISAFLKSGARWTGNVKSNLSSQPEYNSASNEVRWEIDKMVAGQGIINEPAEAVFQVEVTPAVNQVGQSIEFLGESVLQATDSFVNLPFEDRDQKLTTELPDDPTAGSSDKRVQP
ncbi:MAG: Uncharacterized protein G01um101420_775 [Parcubacteria group bacterium Gr01-1014_20]|nr:MAG: Uncharacterized protein G01um101420_775 [Parcubacteria group bacterium Gr01-1014_20]